MGDGDGSAIPPRLVQAFKGRRAAVFIGAGASQPAGMASWQELAGNMASEMNITSEVHPSGGASRFSPRQLASIPQYYENRFGRRGLIEMVRTAIPRKATSPSRIHGLLTDLPCDLYYTTNFDTLLEDALSHNGRDEHDPIVTEQDARDYSRRTSCQVRKLHGTRQNADSIVVTRSDFARFVMDHPLMVSRLKTDLSEMTFLFVGYGLGDPDFNNVYDSVFYTMSPMHIQHYICSLRATPEEMTDLRARGLEPIDLSQWGDVKDDEPLSSFLLQLAEESSDAFYARRFFASIGRGSNVPIIVSSRKPETGRPHPYFPACDIDVALKLQRALAGVGATGEIVVDQEAQAAFDRYVRGDVMLICSPFGNAMAARIFDEADKVRARGEAVPIRVMFSENDDGTRTITAEGEGALFTAANPIQSEDGDGMEYAVLARFHNPWAPGSHIFVFAGLYTLGTQKVADFLDDPIHFKQFPPGHPAAAVILRIPYTKKGEQISAGDYTVVQLFKSSTAVWSVEPQEA